jgi:hypothetical protein
VLAHARLGRSVGCVMHGRGRAIQCVCSGAARRSTAYTTKPLNRPVLLFFSNGRQRALDVCMCIAADRFLNDHTMCSIPCMYPKPKFTCFCDGQSFCPTVAQRTGASSFEKEKEKSGMSHVMWHRERSSIWASRRAATPNSCYSHLGTPILDRSILVPILYN